MNNYFLIAIILLTAGCSGTVKEEKPATITELSKAAEEVVPPTSKHTEAEKYTLQYVDAATVNMVAKLDSVYTRTPYYFKSNEKTYFYVCKGNWVTPEQNSFPDDTRGMGIVNEQGLFILEPNYDKIYNPDATSKGYIEIELNNKKGLLNYHTTKVIPCEFDMIFPSEEEESIAIGKEGSDFFRISKDGLKQKISSPNEIPSFRRNNKWRFDAFSKQHLMLHDSYNPYATNDANSGNGVVFTPSYLLPLGILPEMQTGLITSEEVDFGIDEGKAEVHQTKGISDRIMGLISSFYQSGIDARGYQLTSYHLATIDEQERILDTTMFLQTGETYNYYYCTSELSGYTFLNDSLLEVYQYQNTQGSYQKYDNMMTYSYYTVDKTGKIHPLESNRFFDFTKYIPLTEDYFHGCFAKHIWDVPEEYLDVPGEGSLLLLDHLEVEDLDIMRNEIFAEYGYVFKTEKWHNYFSAKPWYKPKHDSVDSLLTETDKANIILILKVKEKILKDSTIVNKRKIQYAAAG